jgi:hypothetical protein
MTEHFWLFLFSVLMILVSLGGAVWVVASAGLQLETLFLVLVCGVNALVFGVIIRLLTK